MSRKTKRDESQGGVATAPSNGESIERVAVPTFTLEESGVDAWPINWSGIIVGSLAGVAALLLFGLIALAVGAHTLGPAQVVTDWKNVAWSGLIFSVAGAFFSFVIAGWAAGQIAGFRRAENCMLHGACAWMLAIPMIIWLASNGAGSFMGGWFGAISNTHPAWTTETAVKFHTATGSAIPEPTTVNQAEAAAIGVRNAALGIAAAFLLGLMGSVLGGWLSSGEPMSLTYWRIRDELVASSA